MLHTNISKDTFLGELFLASLLFIDQVSTCTGDGDLDAGRGVVGCVGVGAWDGDGGDGGDIT